MTREEKIEKLKILKSDFFQYAKANLKIKTKEGKILPLEFNDPQIYIHEQLEKQLAETGKIRALILKGRQQGASTYTEGRFYWRTSLNFGKQAYILTHEQAATDNLFNMAKRYHDNGHPGLKPSTGASNAKEMLFDKLDSGYKVGTAGSKAVGRSGTIQFFHGCLASGTKIYDPDTGSIRDIESFMVGDNVLTHTGRIAPISFISNQEKECLSVILRGLGKFPLVATKEHRFWTKQGWKELKDLNQGDCIGYPIKQITGKITKLSLPDAPIRSHGGGRQGIYPDEIKLDYNFGRIVGLYLAEGHIKLQHKAPHHPVNISFTIHRNETDRTIEWVNYANQYFSKVSVKHRENSLASIVTVNSNRLAVLMLDLCGRTTGKHLPYNWDDMPEDFCKGLLHGYISGDGHSSDTDRRIRATSICSAITVPLRDMCASLGYGWASIEHKVKAIRSGRNEKEAFIFSLCGDGASKLANEIGKETLLIRKKKKTNSVKNYAASTTEISNGYAWLRIRSIDNAGIKSVYDLEVNHEDHSYCTIHGATHNSELAFWPNAHEHFAGVVQCVPDGNDAEGTEIILESTANGVGGKFHELWMQAINGESEYIAIFVPWFWTKGYRKDATNFKPTPEELRQQKLYGVDNEQLAWRRAKIEEMGKALCDQEYPYCWQDAFLASGRTVFDKEETAAALKECFKPKKRMILENKRFVERKDGELRVWSEPQQGKRYVIGCLPDNEIVITENGYKSIQYVTLDERLIDKDGLPVTIKNIQRRPYSGNIFGIKPYFTSITTKFTGEHPILVLSDTKLYRNAITKDRYYKTETSWKKAKDMTLEDILCFPVLYREELTEQEILSRFPNQENIRIDRRLNENIILDEDFWYFMGLWLAEGWLRNGGTHKLKTIEVCFNSKTEQHQVERFKLIIKNLFNRTASETKKQTNSTELKFNSEAIYKFIYNNFGQKAKHKNISEWIKYLPKKLKLKLFEGYFDGDGCLKTDRTGNKTINCVSISEKMLHDFQSILLSCNIVSGVKVLRNEKTIKIRDRICKTKKTFELNISTRDTQELLTTLNRECNNVFIRKKHKSYGWIENGFFYIKIHEITHKHYDGYVNNFETETHSYCSPLITTHNCDVAEGLEHGDYSSADVLELPSGMQVAQWHGHIAPDLYGNMLYHLGKWFNNALLGVEVNNHGLTTLVTLRDMNYPNLYVQHNIDDRGSNEKETKKIGWATTSKSKPYIIDQLSAELREGEHGICCKETVQEMQTYVVLENGSYGAQLNCFDDRVMSRAIAGEMLRQSPSYKKK
jgi:intein/homing endonuclease